MTDASEATGKPTIFNIHNTLVLLGIVITIIGLVYFSFEYIRRLSEWGRLAFLAAVTGGFVALGRYYESTAEAGGALFHVRGLRWMRIPMALYLVGVATGLVTVIFFTSMQSVDTRVKVLVTTLVGLGLILGAAKLQRGRAGQP